MSEFSNGPTESERTKQAFAADMLRMEAGLALNLDSVNVNISLAAIDPRSGKYKLVHTAADAPYKIGLIGKIAAREQTPVDFAAFDEIRVICNAFTPEESRYKLSPGDMPYELRPRFKKLPINLIHHLQARLAAAEPYWDIDGSTEFLDTITQDGYRRLG